MENRSKWNDSGRFLWNFVITFCILAAIGIWFSNQSEPKELPTNRQKIVQKERVLPKEDTIVKKKSEDEKAVVLATSTKKKVEKPINKKKEEFVAETTVAEDTIANTENIAEGKAKEESVFPGIIDMRSIKFVDQVVGLKITTGDNIPKEQNILKDAEALTRNQEFTYIVDGVRVDEETFRSLNPNDVESVDIYKHSNVTQALYGNKENQNNIVLRK